MTLSQGSPDAARLLLIPSVNEIIDITTDAKGGRADARPIGRSVI